MKDTYKPNDYEIACAATVARMRRTRNSGQSNLPEENASSEELFIQDRRAALGEIAVSRLTNLCWTGVGFKMIDVGDMMEVRSIENNKYGLLARKKDREGLPYVLVLITGLYTCRILGWAFYERILAEGREIGKDTDRPAWVLPQEKLDDLDSLEEYIDRKRKEMKDNDADSDGSMGHGREQKNKPDRPNFKKFVQQR